MIRAVHPIEAESYRIIRSTVDTSLLPRHSRDVAERIIHTTAEPGWLSDLVLDETSLERAGVALTQGAPVVADVHMVAAGITAYQVECGVKSDEAAALARAEGITRSAAGIRLLARQYPAGAIWVVGNAPTALYEIIRLAQAGELSPVLVAGLPVGYVGAADSKEALRASGLPQLSNVSARGGSAVAAAAINALLYGDPLKEHE